MRVKHTFLFTLLLGLGWAGFLFAYENGPDPGVNGIFGTGTACNQAGCHVGNPLNSPTGTLTLTGLPSEWTPGQTYPLTITIQRTGAVTYGFQFSAVFDSNSQQAGSLSKGGTGLNANRISIVPLVPSASVVQYAQHNQINSQSVATTQFFVNWTAPANTSGGAVRFNLAANAANGNAQNTGDFIYTLIEKRSPGAVTTPSSPTRAFAITNFSANSSSTDGTGELGVGYARISATTGTTPAGVEIFGFRQSNVLVSETGVPASTLITSGRIYAEVGGPVNTGLAIANPNSAPATITFFFTNSIGTDFGSGTTVVPANGQVAGFLNEDPYKGGANIQGTFSFTSTVPVSVIALRGYTNEIRNEFLMTTLPVINTSAAASTGTQILPHFANGAGWTTQVILVNPGSTTLAGTVQFVNTAGVPVTLTATSAYSVPPRSSQKLVTSGPEAYGSVRIQPTGGGAAPTPLVVFSYKPAGITLTEAGAPANAGTAFRMYVESSGTPSAPGNIQSGIAVANGTAATASVTFELFNLNGTSAGLTKTISLAASAQYASFLAELFPTLPQPFSGVLRISSASTISVVGLRGRYNERSEFLITTTPPTLESSPASAEELLFPHLVNGGGYTTQFIMFSGTAGQTSAGTLRFFKQNGTALGLILNQ